MADDALRLLCVHAHPDDESSKGAPTVARYHDEGVATVLVCCTGGEMGSILNPAMDSDEIRSNLPAIRREELACAAAIIGYDQVEMLGYRDSGMPGDESNRDPRSFAMADETEAVGKLVTLLRRHRPHVVITYGDDQEMYPHPDHLRVHDVSVAAIAACSDPNVYVDAGEPWSVQKVYYSVMAIKKLKAIHEFILSQGHESPFPAEWQDIPDNEHSITTRVDVFDWREIRNEALRAHKTQIDPASPFWFGFPPELERKLANQEEYRLAQSLVDSEFPEHDLFAGLRK
jgi:mycothiol S-conjugate amidase